MFYLSKDEKSVLDGRKLTVGYIYNGRFSQKRKRETDDPCCQDYVDGLSARELEQISELLQKASNRFI
jgi:hypothetical protein